MIVCLGDVVTDVVVAPAGPLRPGTDTDAVVQMRRGGSAANVAVAASGAGGASRFVGCVGTDRAGRALTQELRAAGVEVAVRRHGRTGAVVVVLSPDGERSFYTDRGACTTLSRLPPGALSEARALHLPAYSLDGEPLATTARHAAERARARGATVTLDASSIAVLERIGPSAIAALGADVVFANRDEAEVLAAAGPLAGYGRVVVVKGGGTEPTRLMVTGRPTVEIAPSPALAHVPDSTGAGDAFAAGFLVALTGGRDAAEATVAGHRLAHAHLRSLGAR